MERAGGRREKTLYRGREERDKQEKSDGETRQTETGGRGLPGEGVLDRWRGERGGSEGGRQTYRQTMKEKHTLNILSPSARTVVRWCGRCRRFVTVKHHFFSKRPECPAAFLIAVTRGSSASDTCGNGTELTPEMRKTVVHCKN